MWPFKCSDLIKARPQFSTGHFHLRWPVCLNWWRRNLLAVVNAQPQFYMHEIKTYILIHTGSFIFIWYSKYISAEKILGFFNYRVTTKTCIYTTGKIWLAYLIVADKGFLASVRPDVLFQTTGRGVHFVTALVIAPEVPVLLVGPGVGAHTVGGEKRLITAIHRTPTRNQTTNTL